MIQRLFVAMAIVAWCFASVSCDSDDSGGVNPSATLENAEFCDTGFPDDCPWGVCRDVVSGQSTRGNTSYNWDRSAIEGTICTKTCDGDSDCDGLAFASTNGHSVSSESWSCSGGYCVVWVQPPDVNVDPCDRCLAACRGLSGCCTGSGCLCEDECN